MKSKTKLHIPIHFIDRVIDKAWVILSIITILTLWAVTATAQSNPNITPDGDNILYVNQSVTGGDESGDSWENVVPELRDAMDWAENDWDGSDAPLQKWAADVVVINVRAEDEPLIDEDAKTTIEDGFTYLAPPEASDTRILAANNELYIFSPADFGQNDNSFLVVIDDMPTDFNGELELDEAPVSIDDEISVGRIEEGDLAWTPPAGEHGYGFTFFDSHIIRPAPSHTPTTINPKNKSTMKNQSKSQTLKPRQTPQIRTLSISRETEQNGPLYPEDTVSRDWINTVWLLLKTSL